MVLLKTTLTGELLAIVLLLAQHQYITVLIAVIALLLLVWHMHSQQPTKGNTGERQKL